MAATLKPTTIQRLIHLLSTLMETKYGLSKDELRQLVYHEWMGPEQDAAFERIFTRDKASLRENGVHVEVFERDDQEFYKIDQDKTLSSIEFTPAEYAVLATVRKMFTEPETDNQLSLAMRRIISNVSVTDTPDEPVKAVPLVLSKSPPVLEDCLDAAASARPITFQYNEHDEPRTVLPYRVDYRFGRWYLIGLDEALNERRMFRLSKMGETVRLGTPQEYPVPDDDEINEAIEQFWNPPKDKVAVVALRSGWNRTLVNKGRRLPQSSIPGYEMFELDYADAESFATQIVRAGPGVLVVEPESLRDLVINQLERLSENG